MLPGSLSPLSLEQLSQWLRLCGKVLARMLFHWIDCWLGTTKKALNSHQILFRPREKVHAVWVASYSSKMGGRESLVTYARTGTNQIAEQNHVYTSHFIPSAKKLLTRKWIYENILVTLSGSVLCWSSKWWRAGRNNLPTDVTRLFPPPHFWGESLGTRLGSGHKTPSGLTTDGHYIISSTSSG